jgi:hypothetical protein
VVSQQSNKHNECLLVKRVSTTVRTITHGACERGLAAAAASLQVADATVCAFRLVASQAVHLDQTGCVAEGADCQQVCTHTLGKAGDGHMSGMYILR